MKHVVFLLFLEALCYVILKQALWFPDDLSFLFSFCFIAVFSILLSYMVNRNIFPTLFKTHLLLFVLYWVVMLSISRMGQNRGLSQEEKRQISKNIDIMYDESDKKEFVKILQAIALLQFQDVFNSLVHLDHPSYEQVLRKWVVKYQTKWNISFHNMIKRYPILRSIPNDIKNAQYDLAYAKISKISDPYYAGMKNWLGYLSRLANDPMALRLEMIRIHKKLLVATQQQMLSTIFLFSDTFDSIEGLQLRSQAYPYVTPVDIYYFTQHLDILNVYRQVHIQNGRYVISFQQVLEDPLNQTLWGVNVSLEDKTYHLVKITKDHISVYNSNFDKILYACPYIKQSLIHLIHTSSNPYDYKWFRASYRKEHLDTYRQYIVPIYSVWVRIVLGMVFISFLVYVTYKVFPVSLSKHPVVVTYLGICLFLMILFCLYFELTLFVVKSMIPHIIHW